MTAASLSGLSDRDIADVVAGTSRIAHALRGARILVTGATGWFGTWLLDALVALDRTERLGLSIVAVSRDPHRFRRRHPALYAAPAIRWVEADLRDPLPALPERFTHVLHAATDTAGPIAPDRLLDTIVRGTAQVLDRAARDPGVRVLLVGSGAVYGRQPPTLARLAETHAGAPDPLDAANAYAEGKRVAELLGAIRHAQDGLQVMLARCFAFVGPHMPFDAHFAVGNFLRDAADGTAIRVDGDGRARRSYLYMSDLVVWLLTILVEGRPMRPYNVGGDEAVSIAALAHRAAVCASHPVDVVIAGGGAGRDYVPDTTRIGGELGVAVTVPLDDALRRTFDWFVARRAVTPAPIAEAVS